MTALPAGDVRPVVARESRPLTGWLLAGAGLVIALLLFAVLESRRQTRIAPATRPRASELARLPSAPAPLFIPPERVALPPPIIPIAPPPAPLIPVAPPSPTLPVRAVPPAPFTLPPSTPITPQPQPQPQRTVGSGSALVIDTTTSTEPTNTGQRPQNVIVNQPGEGLGAGATGNRVRAGQVGNPATTVPQGTLIPAVLETALDSTRPGQVRALVSRDVRGFDGTQVLIPRGSRLFGEYRADLRPGQKRAFVQWTRLVRPDGVSVAIASPAADPLGRAGIRGKVNSHFFERFGSAILQSTLDIGVAVGTQQFAGGSNVVLVPGAAQAFRPNIQLPIQPTLTVKQGARVTVFVANDLDFTGAATTRP